MAWTALLLAGQRPGIDPLAAHFGETWKALVQVRGQTMLSRVARTLLDCRSIDRIIVLGQAPGELTATPDTAWLGREPRIELHRSIASISQSVAAVAGAVAAWPVLVTTADHALLTTEMVEDFIAGVGDADVAVALVERANLLGRYPGNKRTWLKFRGGAYSGANLFALTGDRARAALDLWAGVEQDRKKGWKLVAAFGPLLLLRALSRTVTLHDGLAAAGRRLGLKARAVVLRQPEAAIDVDKPADHELAESIFSARG
ncbi:MAG: NTP transferase domain-containing protein [Sphingomonadaceae bacterium]|nr:NTP transferase domain-containing protein [Sphingomonadaceae bacterium]